MTAKQVLREVLEHALRDLTQRINWSISYGKGATIVDVHLWGANTAEERAELRWLGDSLGVQWSGIKPFSTPGSPTGRPYSVRVGYVPETGVEVHAYTVGGSR